MDPAPSVDPNNSPKNSLIPQNDTAHEDSVHIAATALNDMRSASSHPVASPTPPPPDPAISRLPSVLNQAINLYESSKANSRLVSYGAGMVESGVQAISKPVLDRLPTRVLTYARADPSPSANPSRDESQSMQIDNSERESSSSDPGRDEQRQRALSWTHQQRESHRHDNGRSSVSAERRATSHQMDTENDDDEPMDLSPRDRSQGPSSGSARTAVGSDAVNSNYHGLEVEPSQHAVSRRGGWHSLMVEAGGISAAVSDESMRKLKYCLEWLQWATSNLDTQITLLETFISSINATVTGEPVPPSATVSPEALQHYMAVKKNVVNTIRRVVDVVGKYAGGSLPDPAKQKVKGFILSLPGRWSVAVKEAGFGDSWGPDAAEEASATAEGNSTSRAGPPSNSNPRKRNRLESSSQSVISESTAVGSVVPSSAGTSSASIFSSRPGVVGPPGAKRPQLLPPTAGAARHAASRVLTLAQESLHAVKGVTGVFKDTLDRAEAWVDRLRWVGYNQPRRYMEDSDQSVSSKLLPPPHRGPPSVPISPAVSSPRSPFERRRLQMTPRELHLEALARSIPSVGPYGPYGSGNTPPGSPILGPLAGNGTGSRNKSFPFDNPAPGAPGYGWVGGRRKSDSGLSAVPTLNLSENGNGVRSRAGSMSQYESSTGESLPPPSVVGSTGSVGGDDELDDEGEFDTRHIKVASMDSVADADDEEGMEYRVRKRRRKEEEVA